MAAYAALVSIMQIFDQIENHPSPPISMDKKQVESLTEIVVFLQEFLESYKSPFADGDEPDPLEMRIADAVHAAEDVIESHIADQIRPTAVSTSADLNEALINVLKHIDVIKEEMMEIVAVKSQLPRQASVDLYSGTIKLIEHMDLIEEELLEIVEIKDQLQIQVWASADFYESLVRVIEDVNLIKEEVTKIGRHLAYADSQPAHYPTYADLCGRMMKLIKHMDLIMTEVMEIYAVKDQPQIQVSPSAGLYESLVKVIEDMYIIKKEVMLLEIVAVKDQLLPDDVGGSSTTSKMFMNNFLKSSLSRPNNTTMVGFDDVMLQLMEKLIYGELSCQVIPIVGMGGIGKTTLAVNVYANPLITHHFDICAWVTISQQFNTKEFLCEILCQANQKGLSQMSEDEIGLTLHKHLSFRRYIIVLDDMWSIEAWEKMQVYFPDNCNGSRIMVTTRLSNLGSQLQNNNYGLKMKFMDEKSSWHLFCKTVFGVKSFPLELEEIGKKIVESCRGLPLTIVVMGGLLEKLEPTKECWESIRRNISSIVNSENDMHCLKVLKLSYNHLPVYLKPCFLFMGMYEEDSKIHVSTIVKLWVSEGFLKPIRGKSLEIVAKEYLEELVCRNLILVHKLGKTGNMKYLKIHDMLRDLCLREAEKERLYHVVGKHSPQVMSSQTRVVVPRSTSMREIIYAMRSTPHARSYTSDHEKNRMLPVSKLLRTLTAHNNVRSRLPVYYMRKFFELVNLRFLCVRHSRCPQLPSSVLWSLQTLILSHIGYSGDTINASVEIWNMPQLRHVHFWTPHGRSHLPNPPIDNIVTLENLQTLKGVKNFKCDEMMLCRIPNIKKLGIIYDQEHRIESHDDDYCVYNIERLQKLESVQCIHCPSGDFCESLLFHILLRA